MCIRDTFEAPDAVAPAPDPVASAPQPTPETEPTPLTRARRRQPEPEAEPQPERPSTRAIPIVAPEVDLSQIAGLGVADRLGLGQDDEDEVGPTA